MAVANLQKALQVDRRRLRRAVRAVLRQAGVAAAEISLAIVDHATMRPLNRRHLGHDYATDVLSFVLERDAGRLEGEVIVDAQTALRAAPRYGWKPADELLLYVVHGTLHLVGCDDQSPDDRAVMRQREAATLARFGLRPRE